jgi:hypothetical protein
MLYVACAIAAIAQSPADVNLHSRSVVDSRPSVIDLSLFPAIKYASCDSGSIEEVRSGEWGIGGQPLTTEGVHALIAGRK